MSTARFIVSDVFEGLASLPDNSVDLVLSSPPFLALRSYLPADHPRKAKEIGSEPTPADFIDTLLDVVVECRRVLAPHGSLVFELGDTFAGSGGAGGDYAAEGMREGQPQFTGSKRQGNHRNDKVQMAAQGINPGGWPLDKSLTFIPQLFGASLAYGRNLLNGREIEPWRVRNVVAWCRPNPPVGALGDKFRPATSYLTVACVARDRYFDLDAVRTELKHDYQPYDRGATSKGGSRAGKTGEGPRMDRAEYNPAGAPPLDWWEIPTAPYKGSHYATWPPNLLVKPILSMCPERVCRVCGEPSRRIVEAERHQPAGSEPSMVARQQGDKHGTTPLSAFPSSGSTTYTTTGWTDCGHDDYRPGIVLDPFAGSGTTLAVATGHGRDAIGIDLDERNADLAQERVGMFLSVDSLVTEAS